MPQVSLEKKPLQNRFAYVIFPLSSHFYLLPSSHLGFVSYLIFQQDIATGPKALGRQTQNSAFTGHKNDLAQAGLGNQAGS